MLLKWEKRFVELAEHIAQWSKDPSTKVGAVIFDPNRRHVLGTGYNGFPRGCVDSTSGYADRSTKYLRVVHAEVNAVLNCTLVPRGQSMAVTKLPCVECSKVIIQSGIQVVYTFDQVTADPRWMESQTNALQLMWEAGVEVFSGPELERSLV